MQNSKHVRLNTAIIPTKDFYDFSIKLSEEISSEFKTDFTLSGALNLPHITMYPPEYPESSQEQVVDMVSKIASENRPFSISVKSLDVNEGWVQISFQVTPMLYGLHKTLVERLSPYREDRIRDKYRTSNYVHLADSKTLSLIDFYGYPAVLGNFSPHLTICHLKNYFDELEVKKLIERKPLKSQMDVESIGVHLSGEFGTARKLVAQFRLRADK